MNRTVLKHLKALEEKLEEQDRNDENVTEILELLLQYENAMEPLQLTPNYAELDLELVQSTVRVMIEQGLWKNSAQSQRGDSDGA